MIGVEPDATLLARTFRYAQAHNTPIQLITAKVENSLLQDNVADMVRGAGGAHEEAEMGGERGGEEGRGVTSSQAVHACAVW